MIQSSLPLQTISISIWSFLIFLKKSANLLNCKIINAILGVFFYCFLIWVLFNNWKYIDSHIEFILRYFAREKLWCLNLCKTMTYCLRHEGRQWNDDEYLNGQIFEQRKFGCVVFHESISSGAHIRKVVLKIDRNLFRLILPQYGR